MTFNTVNPTNGIIATRHSLTKAALNGTVTLVAETLVADSRDGFHMICAAYSDTVILLSR